MNKNPCYNGRTPDETFCPHRDEDKKTERCANCKSRIKYAVAEGMLPHEALGQMTVPELGIKKKTGPKPKAKKTGRYVHLRFPDRYMNIYSEIEQIADIEHRTIIMQIIHFLQQGLDAYNKKKGGDTL